MEQVQDAVTRAGGLALAAEGLGEAKEKESGVEWAPSVPARRPRAERGMVSAEWAVGIVAAVAIAGVLLAVVTTGTVKDQLLKIVITMLKTFLKFAG